MVVISKFKEKYTSGGGQQFWQQIENEYLTGWKKGWYRGLSWNSNSNQGCEGIFNADKSACLRKFRHSLKEFFHKSFIYYEEKSEEDAMAENLFKTEPKITKKMWADAQMMMETDWYDDDGFIFCVFCSMFPCHYFCRYQLKLKKPQTSNQHLVPSWLTYDGLCGDDEEAQPSLTEKRKENRELLKTHIRARYCPGSSELDFDEHMAADKSHYLVAPLPAPIEKQYIFFECSCKAFRKEFACWHSLIFSLKSGKASIPRGMSITDIGERPGPGAPRRMTGALVNSGDW